MKLRCRKCGNIMEGDKRGTFIQCSRKSIAIEEAKRCPRYLYKNPDAFEIIDGKNDENDTIEQNSYILWYT